MMHEFSTLISDKEGLNKFFKASKRHLVVTEDFSKECMLTVLIRILSEVGKYPNISFLQKLKKVVKSNTKITKENKELLQVLKEQADSKKLIDTFQKSDIKWILRLSNYSCEVIHSLDPLRKTLYKDNGKIVTNELSGLRTYFPNFCLEPLICWRAL